MKKNFKKKLAPLALTGLILVGASAWISTKETQQGVNKIKSGSVILKFVDSEDAKRQDTVITLNGDSLIPMTEAHANKIMKPYNFTLKNEGDVDLDYTLYMVEDESQFDSNVINVDIDGANDTFLPINKATAVEGIKHKLEEGTLKARESKKYDKLILFADSNASNPEMLNNDGSGRIGKYHLEVVAEQHHSTSETTRTSLKVANVSYLENGVQQKKYGNISEYLKSNSPQEFTNKMANATFAEILGKWEGQELPISPSVLFWDTNTDKVVWLEKDADTGEAKVYDTDISINAKIFPYLQEESWANAEYTWNLPKLELRVSGTIRIAYLANNLSQGIDQSEQPSFTTDKFINYTSLSDKENKTSVALKDYLFTLDECKQKYNSSITFVAIEPDTNKVITAKVDGSGGLEFIYDTGLTGDTLLKDAIVENPNPAPYNYVWNFTEYTKRG